MAINKDSERDYYVNLHNLQDSFIDKKILFQYQNVIPQRKYVGRTDSGYKVFYEETQGSLTKRNYGKSDKVTSWNLLYSDGETSKKVSKTFVKNNKFFFCDGYSASSLIYFLENNTKNFNALDNEKSTRKIRTIYVEDEEYDIIKDFIKKLRER